MKVDADRSLPQWCTWLKIIFWELFCNVDLKKWTAKMSCLLVAWLQRTCYINLYHDHYSMKVIDLKKAKKLLKAQSVQCKLGFVLAKFVYWSLDNVCSFIEWVQLTSYSTIRGSYNKKLLLLIELNCVLKEMEHEK